MDSGEQMDILMINALLDSLLTIFATMVKLDIEPGIPVLKLEATAKGSVSGLIGMNAEGASGSVALSLTLPAVREISRKLLGEEIACVDQSAADLVGELTNMLVGRTKQILSEKGFDFDMQRPKLLLGEGHEIVHHCAGKTVLLPIKINSDEFYLELNFV